MDAERLVKVFGHGRVVAFVCEPHQNWRPVWVSGSVRDLLGIDPAVLVDGEIDFIDLVHPDDVERALSPLRGSGHSREERISRDEYRIRHADGHWLWVHDRRVLEHDEHGRPTSLIGYLIDITEHRELEAELRVQRERAELVLEGTRLGRWDWDPIDNSVVFDERWAQMLGYELGEIPMNLESWSSRVHPEDLAHCFGDIQRHIDGEVDYYENVHRMRHRDGHWVWILDRGRIVERDGAGRALRFAGTHTDISAQKEAEIAAQRANEAKSVFLARMSHEIRTPLNGVLGVLQLLQGTRLDAQQSEFTETIRASGETLLTIINDILDLSKIEAGEFRLDPHDFEPRRMLGHVHDLYRERAQSKGLQYTLEIHDQVPDFLRGDDHRVRQVLSNLLSNAVKFTAEGSIVLRVQAPRLDDGRVMFTARVLDTGPGIADVEAIWEPFRQESAQVAREHGGTGLGLSICRQLAGAMQGTVDLESTVGMGSTFTLRLPLEAASSAASRASVTAIDPAAELPVLRVLVAEDNQVNRMVIGGVLTKLGQDFRIVENGREAVEACETDRFDLVLMDIHMPELNGFEAAAAIRARIAPERRPRIVAISADAFAPANEAFLGSGMEDQVTKPFRIDEIARVVAESAKAAADPRRPSVVSTV